MAYVHVVRHGEVENPEKILYGRQPGWRLSTRGQHMAETIAEWSDTLDLGALHVSPLQRAQETATPVSQRHKIAITTDPQLIEAGNKFEGKKFHGELVADNSETGQLTIRINHRTFQVKKAHPLDDLIAAMGLDKPKLRKLKEMQAPMPGRVTAIHTANGKIHNEATTYP